jgi:hypothetical protein
MTVRDTHRTDEAISKAPAAMVREELQSAKVTLTGTPHAFTFMGAGLENMKDTAYRVTLTGKFVASTRVDEPTITEAGFSIIGGAAAEVAHIMVHGKIASRRV